MKTKVFIRIVNRNEIIKKDWGLLHTLHRKLSVGSVANHVAIIGLSFVVSLKHYLDVEAEDMTANDLTVEDVLEQLKRRSKIRKTDTGSRRYYARI